jgi:hypothetical protein
MNTRFNDHLILQTDWISSCQLHTEINSLNLIQGDNYYKSEKLSFLIINFPY